MKNNNIIIIQSRQTSTRFPNKVLKKLEKFTVCEIIKKRVEKSKLSKQIIFAIPNNNKNKKLFHHLKKIKANIFLGSEKMF